MVGRASAATDDNQILLNKKNIKILDIKKKRSAAKQLIGPIHKRKDPEARLLDLQKANIARHMRTCTANEAEGGVRGNVRPEEGLARVYS